MLVMPVCVSTARVRVPPSTFVGGSASIISLRRLFVMTAWVERNNRQPESGSRIYGPVRHTVKRCRPMGVNVFVCAAQVLVTQLEI